jgi:Protease inhibitor Inh
MSRQIVTLYPALGVGLSLVLTLGGCANISRFDGAAAPRASSVPIYQTPQSAAQGGFQSQPGSSYPGGTYPGGGAAPGTGVVTASPLPPPGGSTQVAATQATGLPGAVAQPVDPLFTPQPASGAAQTTGSTAQELPTLSGGGGRVATLGGERASSGRTGPVTSRDGVIGGWTAREATGTTCKVQLSSSPALDLYRASASGCANKELQKVTAWDYRDGEVYLYQPGGAVAARMRANDGSSLSGAIARSGAGLSLSR